MPGFHFYARNAKLEHVLLLLRALFVWTLRCVYGNRALLYCIGLVKFAAYIAVRINSYTCKVNLLYVREKFANFTNFIMMVNERNNAK